MMTGRYLLAAPPNHVTVGGVPIFAGGLDAALEFCLGAIRERRSARIATANLDFLALAARDRQLKMDLQNSDMVVADGVPVVWLAKLAGAAKTARVAGVDLVERICASSNELGGLRVVFYGSSSGVATVAAERLVSANPGLSVPVVLCPPFRAITAEEQARHLVTIAEANPHVVLVALGCPRQERFIAEASSMVQPAVWIGVGGTFDFFAGRRKRAPRALQATGLEWLFRMAQEPRRLGKRYLLRDLPALGSLAARCAARRILSASNRGPAEHSSRADCR